MTDGPWMLGILQVVVAAVGIIVAALWAKWISQCEHDRQLVYQTRQDVAKMLNILDDTRPALERGELYGLFSNTGPNDDDPVDMGLVQETVYDAYTELRNIANVLRLTAPTAIYGEAECVREAVHKYLNAVEGVVLEQGLHPKACGAELRDRPFEHLREQIFEREDDLIRVAQEIDRPRPWIGKRAWRKSRSFLRRRWHRVRRRSQ